MDILKEAIVWAKSELISTPFFVLFGLVFMATSLGLFKMGKTEFAKAYIVPTLVAGLLLSVIGLGLYYTNKNRITQFQKAYAADPSLFVSSELERTEATLKEYKNVVFTAIPILLALCALVLGWVEAPLWRASMITFIGMLSVILMIDGLAHARIAAYHQQLLKAQSEINS